MTDKPTYKSCISQVTIYREDNLRVLQTQVSLEDEGGGEFVSITDCEGNHIRLDFEEFDLLVEAVKTFRQSSTNND
jgi:hypothetical protein